MSKPLTTPVGFFIFNRPIETACTFAAIREAKPAQLFVVADGPRNDSDIPLCEAARAVINVDWPCEVKTNYSEVNMGCGKRPATGISWIFEQVEQAIIIEDDCIPDQSFFPFAEELLEKYKNDERVMHIASSSFQEYNPRFDVKESYYASFIPSAFGCWATWRRAWNLYDYNIKKWPTLKSAGVLKRLFHNAGGYERFAQKWDNSYNKQVTDSWDAQWAFACMSRGAICLTPKFNLVQNIGFNERGTHTKKAEKKAEILVHAMPFPLIHPTQLTINREADNYMFWFYFDVDKKLRYKLLRPFKTAFPNLYQKIKKLIK